MAEKLADNLKPTKMSKRNVKDVADNIITRQYNRQVWKDLEAAIESLSNLEETESEAMDQSIKSPTPIKVFALWNHPRIQVAVHQ